MEGTGHVAYWPARLSSPRVAPCVRSPEVTKSCSRFSTSLAPASAELWPPWIGS